MRLLYSRRSFDGAELLWSGRPLHYTILKRLRQCKTPQTAWQVAKAINALGCTVSSLMFRMRKKGQLVALTPLTIHGGRVYRAA